MLVEVLLTDMNSQIDTNYQVQHDFFFDELDRQICCRLPFYLHRLCTSVDLGCSDQQE